MADVFISYAREDRAFVARLAPAIEALGLSVWWDDKLAPGREFELEIERELDAARAVVAVWSAASLRSVAVRAEAREALDQEKLAPVRIAPVKPPLFSRGIQFADLEGWDGDAAAVAFQDLAAQLFALVHGQAAASRVPRDGATRPSAETVLADDAPILNLPLLNRPIGPFKSAAGLLGFLLAAAGLAALFVNREDILGPYWEAVFVLALSAIALFSAAERQLAPNVKAMIARWLQPQPNARPLRSAEAFLAMFEAVFSKRHLTLRCFIASAVASVLVYAGLLLLWAPLEVLEEAARKLFDGEIESPDPNQWTTVGRSAVETNAALLFLAVPVANIVVDYFSLWQTRGILKLAAGR
ncbi:MAG: toll/interleukin-1 receptor domain-containing protein, partial [Pseudomonadota bacterium]